ncbi:centrosomal AT-AC splicing factor-like [Saccostrea echinata]|uniref:centrosomal AT-AC splicing factor-like n=1 Tax=Saccostrea echinata TaxID=191078 RepID=UPI002A818E66|nr:centrosomal AT-AC splicing factor-like [Saccostrea echinata]
MCHQCSVSVQISINIYLPDLEKLLWNSSVKEIKLLIQHGGKKKSIITIETLSLVFVMFKQFQYCSLCRFSHKKKRKHIYSIRHQNVVNNILEKYLKKMTEARSSLESPQIQSSHFERGAKFWCHFCAEEYLKHMELDTCTVKYGGLLEHIASFDHKRKMYNFFYENKVDESKRHPDLFHMPEEDLKKFQEKVAIYAKKYDAGRKEKIEKTAIRIKITEAVRKQMVQSQQLSMVQPQIIENTTPERRNVLNYVSPGTVLEKKATLLAKGDGLTFIGSHVYNSKEGNIHSGAPPPWLLSSNEESTNNEIGPTEETFKAHLEREKKKKLPANRVGANFDHQQNTDQSWLPSFGRVWSKGGRQQSKKYFQRQHSTKKISPSSTYQATSSRETGSSSLTNNTANDLHLATDSIVNFNGEYPFHSNIDTNSSNISQVALNVENPVSDFSGFQLDQSGVMGSDASFSYVPGNVKPYVKKHRIENSTSLSEVVGYAEHHVFESFQHQNQTGVENAFVNHSSISRNVKPYVRKRHVEEAGSSHSQLVDFIPMIPTPILDAQSHPANSKLKKRAG